MSARRVMPKGSGGVRCLDCGAHAAADGKGNPIVLRHKDDCPQELERSYRDREDERIIRALVEYCDSHPQLNVSAYDLMRAILDVEDILDGRNARELLHAMERLSDTGNE